MTDPISLHVGFKSNSPLFDDLLKNAITSQDILAKGHFVIQEIQESESETDDLEAILTIIVQWENHNPIDPNKKGRLVFPVSENQLVQFAREILRQFAPTTEDLILTELRRLNQPKDKPPPFPVAKKTKKDPPSRLTGIPNHPKDENDQS